MVHIIKKNPDEARRLRGFHKFKAEIQSIKDRGYVTESELKLIRRRLNDNKISYEDVEILNDMPITPEQTKKGLDWLMNKWKTPRGIERKNNPFGLREQDALATFKEFRLNSFTNNNTSFQAEIGMNNWTEVWDVIGSENSFQYIMEAGEPKIIG